MDYCEKCGLVFKKNENEESYSVRGIYSRRTSYEIPTTFMGLPVTGIADCAFGSCDELTSIVIPDSVTSIGNSAFYNCEKLASAVMDRGVEKIGKDAFWGCKELKEIVIPEHVTSIGESAFFGCLKLWEVYNKSALSIKAGEWENGAVGYYAVEVYTEPYESKVSTDKDGYIVYTCGDGKILLGYSGKKGVLTLPKDITKIHKGAFYSCNVLTDVVIPENAKSIGKEAFAYCAYLKSVKIDGASSIGKKAFDACVRLTDITFSDSVKSIGEEAFAYCKLLKKLEIGGGVTSIESKAFRACEQLESVVISESVKFIGLWAFKDCENLENVYYKGDVAGWCSISFDCAGTDILAQAKNLYIGGTLLEGDLVIPDGVTSIGQEAFCGYEKLTGVVIPDSVKSIGNYAFYECYGLKNLCIGKGVTRIGDYAFEACRMNSLEIPDSVESVGEKAFMFCARLESLKIGGGVKNIETDAFQCCEELKSITFNGTVAKWKAVNKASLWAYGAKTKTVVCLDGEAEL